MLKRLLILGSLVLSPVAVMGDTQTGNQADTVSYLVQPGQGNAYTVVIPTTPVAQPPYALTGDSGTPRFHFEGFRFGQSGPVTVYLGN